MDLFNTILSIYLIAYKHNLILVHSIYLVALLFPFQNQRLKKTQSCWQEFSFSPFFVLFIRQEQPPTLNQPSINGNEGENTKMARC